MDKPAKVFRYYRVQVKEESVISEWDDVLHQYTSEGNGTKIADYDEAMVLAEQVKRSTCGVVSVITVENK